MPSVGRAEHRLPTVAAVLGAVSPERSGASGGRRELKKL